MNRFPTWLPALLVSAHLLAHDLVLNVIDNRDGTITVAGALSTGESAAGALVRLQALHGEETFREQRLPDESRVTLKIPDRPYRIILIGGREAPIVQPGVAPPGGFKTPERGEREQAAAAKQNGTAIPNAAGTSLALAFVLLAATLWSAVRNTRRTKRPR